MPGFLVVECFMEIFLSVMIFVLGLCLGSFVNMLVYRVAVGYGIVSSRGQRPWRSRRDCFAALAMTHRSFCDGCGRQLKWYENIPVISWILQNGKTRCCKKKLPLAYPITELMMGILLIFNFKFLILNQFQILNFQTFFLFFIESIIIVFLVFSAAFDLKYMILPDFSTVILLACTVILLIIGRSQEPPLQNIFTGLVVMAFFWFLHLITRGKGMGMGDVKLVFFIGLFLGWQKTIVALYTAFIVGAIIGIILIILNKAKRKTEVPFGPFLILGTFVGWWWGNEIWYYVLKMLY